MRRSRFVYTVALGAVAVIAGTVAGDDPPAPRVVVTGANRGLGLEFARQLAATGWEVIGTARRPEAAEALRALGVRVVQLDVADPASVARLAAEIGDAPVEMLINNAGIGGGRVLKLEDVDFEIVERVLKVNTLGPMRVTQALLPALRRGQRRTVVNITSGLGSIAGNTRGGYYGYPESKAALNMFTRGLAAELKPERFICIVMSPGWVRTDMGGPNAPLSPEESIRGMLSVIGNLDPSDSGGFFSHDGGTLPW